MQEITPDETAKGVTAQVIAAMTFNGHSRDGAEKGRLGLRPVLQVGRQMDPRRSHAHQPAHLRAALGQRGPTALRTWAA
jgi:hypothetical protein